jgi:uncharacterized protein
MEKMRLGRTGLSVSRSGFGCIPIQRLGFEEAGRLLRKAYDAGIDFFDTARGYTDSEEKIGAALSGVRKDIVLATKTPATKRADAERDLDTSLRNLKTDYIDVYQLHNPKEPPDPSDEGSAYAAARDAKKKGKVRFIGITNHRLDAATKAAGSGLFDTVQFPFSFLSSEKDIDLVRLCVEKDLGFIAMKALSGGLITDVRPSFAFLRQFPNVLPIWGLQRESELDEFVALEKDPPALYGELLEKMEKDRKELSGAFCRGCGYCLPCPAGIPINMAARISFFLTRSLPGRHLTEDWKNQMLRINDCTECGSCSSKCPYGLETPKLLKSQLEWYLKYYDEHAPKDGSPAKA